MSTQQNLTGYPSIDKPWLKYYSEEAINAKLPECTIYEYLWENNKNHLDDVALIYFGKKISYKTLFKEIDLCEKGLTALGVKSGDIVTVAMPSIPEALYAVYAINKMGAVANMIHPLAGGNEICDYLNEVQSVVFLMFDGTYEIVKSMLKKTNVKCAVVLSPAESLPFGVKWLYKRKNKSEIFLESNVISWSQLKKAGAKHEVTKKTGNCDALAIISHTGGTTGTPKGVMLTSRNVNAVIWQIGCNLPHRRQETMLVVLPPFINYSLVNGMLEPLAFGFKVVLIPEYKPDKFGEYIKKYHPNHINSIPAYWEAILEIKELEQMDLSCLRHIFYGGDSLNPQKEEEINKLLLSRGAQFKLAKGLGSTEMVSAATVTYDECNVIGTVGIPLVKVNCKIVEPGTQTEISYLQEGEICFSGPSLMLGYYEKQEETDAIIKVHEDGIRWLHTGDLGYIDKDGLVYLSGRIKRIIMTKGKDETVTKMFPDRIEKAIQEHPLVSLCCVVGVPDSKRINYAKAIVVLKDGSKETENIKAEIFAICKHKLPEYMVPERIEFMKEMPRTERGKVNYRALEQESK